MTELTTNKLLHVHMNDKTRKVLNQSFRTFICFAPWINSILQRKAPEIFAKNEK